MTIIDLLVNAKIVSSKSEARRELKQRAIRVDNQTVDDSYVFQYEWPDRPTRPMDVKSIECLSFNDFFKRGELGEYEPTVTDPFGDVPFRMLHHLIKLVGVRGINKPDLWAHKESYSVAAVLSIVYVVNRGKHHTWIVRLDETPSEFYQQGDVI